MTIGQKHGPEMLKQLLAAARQRIDTGMARRAAAVARHFSGKTYRQVAQELGMSKDTLRRALRRFERFGVPGLATRPHGGSRPRIRHRVAMVIEDLIRRHPRDFGYDRAHWTLKSLSDCLRKHFNISAGYDCIRHALIEKGYKWRRITRGSVALRPSYHWRRD